MNANLLENVRTEILHRYTSAVVDYTKYGPDNDLVGINAVDRSLFNQERKAR